MQYEQRNPLPIPPTSPSESIAAAMRTVFDGRYALERENPKESTEDPEPMPPAELVALLARFRAGSAAAGDP